MTQPPTPSPLTGREYLESLDDGREVWIYGERAHNVAAHPAFRNAARMVARLYDAMHDPACADRITVPTEWGGRTHRFFRACHSAQEQVAARDAIAESQRISFGWMGRTPDYKGSLIGTLGANAAFYSGYEDNALRWYRKAQERTWFINHALVHPPVDRASGDGADVFVRVERETDAGIVVSGAKVVATSAALTHYTFVAHSGPTPLRDPRYAPVFMLHSATRGVKMICRASYEQRAAMLGTPFDYPLSSRLDENDAILVLDRVFVPWEDVFMHGDCRLASAFASGSGFDARASLHGCTRLATKLDFVCGLFAKALEVAGVGSQHGSQVRLGEVLAWRNTFWALSDAMANGAVPWNGMVQPDSRYAAAYRVMSQTAYPIVRGVIEACTGGLLQLVSHADDFRSSELRPYLDRYLSGSEGVDSEHRAKVMKLLWDAIGTEFGGRHALYEVNYMGSDDRTRLLTLSGAERSGELGRLKAQVDRCLSEYDLNGWTSPDLAQVASKAESHD